MNKPHEIIPFFDASLDIREFATLPRGELARIAYRLGELLRNHEFLAEQLYRTIICGITLPTTLVSEDAHNECEFGRWYKQQVNECFAENPFFIELGRLHREVHQTASYLAKLKIEGKNIHTESFDAFAQSRIVFRDKLLILRDRLAGAWSFLDPLTGVLRREAMQVILYQEQSRVDRGNYQSCIAMVDVDHFKQVNDNYGHQAGDFVLQKLAQSLLNDSRNMDTVFRYGGEELLICLPDITLTKSKKVLDRLRSGIARNKIPVRDNKLIAVTISIGVTALQKGVPVETSISHADHALYQAKAAGRNRIVHFESKTSG